MPYSKSSVDEQVVKMLFDNSNFDSNINDSIKTLNNLDNRLAIINKDHFGKLTNSINGLATTFTVKGQVMFGVLSRLGSELVTVAKRGVNELTKGLRDGVKEYELIIDSTQTIYQNVKQSGASLENVTAALDELNDYADKTIYNFGEMTRMIGMFTAAGVDLKRSVNTIKGLANAAALVGANSYKAQVAWNAVSRAMSSGTFSNITWRSLELSGIAGEQFNTVIKEVARVNKVVGKSGQNIDQMIKKYGTLRESLREKWLTKDLFAEAMQIMSGELDKDKLRAKGYSETQIEQLTSIAEAAEEAATRVKTFQQLLETTAEAIGSGWAQSFRILIGDLEDAKILYTRISDVISDFIDNSSKIRNDLFEKIVGNKKDGILGRWKTGRDDFRQIIENMLAIVKTFLKSIETGFLNIFPIDRISAAAQKVLDITNKFTKALVLNVGEASNSTEGIIKWDTHNATAVSESIKDLIRLFRGLASAIDVAWMAISQPAKVILERIPFFRKFFDNTNSGIINLLKNLGKFGDKLTVFRDAVKDTQIFGAVLEYFLDNIEEIGNKYPILGFFVNIFNNLKKAIIKVKEGFRALDIKPLNALFGAFKFIVTIVLDILNSIFEVFKSIKNKIDWSFLDKPKAAIASFVRTLSYYGKGLISFKDVTDTIGKSIRNNFGKIIDSINKLFNKSKLKTGTGEIKTYMSDLNTNTSKIGAKLADIWTKIKNIFGSVGAFFKNVFQGADFTLEGIIKKFALIAGGAGIAALGINNLVKTFKKIQIINNLNDLLDAGIDVIKAYERQAQSKTIINIAIAIGILAASLAVLAFIPYENLENGLAIFTGFISVLSVTLSPLITAIAKFNESLGKMKKALTIFDVLNNFGKKIAQGINSKLMGSAAKDFAIAIAIITGAIASLVIMFSVNGEATEKALKSMTGLILAFTVLMTVFTAVVSAISKAGPNAKTAASIFSAFFTLTGVSAVVLSIAAALAILVKSLDTLSKIDNTGLDVNFKYFKELLLWLGGIAAALTLIVSFVNIFNKNQSKAGVSGVAIIVVSIAGSVALMAAALSKLAEKDPKKIRKAFKYVKDLLKTIGLFASLMTALVALSRLLGDYRDNTVRILLAMMISVVAISGALTLLGKAEHIDDSVISTLTTLTIALGIISAVIIAIAAVVMASNSTFSTGFVSVIKSVAISIAAIITSIGIMTAGIAALFHSLGNIKATNEDSNRASNAIITRLKIVAGTIKKSLPEIKKVFYSIGEYAGSAFTAFNLGFIGNIASTGEVYNQLIIKIVNIILDILGKALNALYSRKEDIRRIIRQVVDLIGAIFTEVINDVFLKNSMFKAKEEDVLKLLGFGGLTVGGGAILLKLSGNFNTLFKSAENVSSIFEKLGLDWMKDVTISENLWYNANALQETLANTKAIGSFGNTVAKVLTGIKRYFGTGEEAAIKFSANATNSLGTIAAAVAAVIVAIKMIGITFHSISQMIGKEATYIRSDVKTVKDAFIAFLTDSNYRAQSIIDVVTSFALNIVNIIMTVVQGVGGIVAGLLSFLSYGLGTNVTFITGQLEAIGIVSEGATEKVDNFFSSFSKTSFDFAGNMFKNIVNDWKKWWTQGWKNTDYVIDGSKQTIDALEESGEEISETYYDIGVESNASFVDGFTSKNPLESALSWLNNSGFVSGTSEWISDSLRMVGIEVGGTAEEVAKDIFENFKVTDNDGIERTIELNKDYLDIIIEEKDVLKNVNKENQIAWIQRKAAEKGIEFDAKALGDTYAAILLNQEDQTRLSLTGINAVQDKVENALARTRESVFSKSLAAEEMYVTDYMNSANLVAQIARDNVDDLVGMKEEEVEEYLTKEAMKQGLSEEEAREAAKKIMSVNKAASETNAELTRGEILKKIDYYDGEYDAFKKLEDQKTKYQKEASEIREEIAKNEERFKSGNIDAYTYAKENTRLIGKLNAIEKKYKQDLKEFVTGKDSNTDTDKLFNDKVKEYEDSLKEADKAQKRSFTTTIKQFLDKIKNGTASGIDLGSWNFDNKKDPTELPDVGNKTAVDAASDLKNDLEAQRADLTPTFDLDKLASDANKANGIVMSSLMAAQNASIGDYINKDSELNPFMKDRWQNVYNFTQNNYSPKALSRIDIYRQTQRQISMSRGF